MLVSSGATMLGHVLPRDEPAAGTSDLLIRGLRSGFLHLVYVLILGVSLHHQGLILSMFVLGMSDEVV